MARGIWGQDCALAPSRYPRAVHPLPSRCQQPHLQGHENQNGLQTLPRALWGTVLSPGRPALGAGSQGHFVQVAPNLAALHAPRTVPGPGEALSKYWLSVAE